jgi:hypothetical protein
MSGEKGWRMAREEKAFFYACSDKLLNQHESAWIFTLRPPMNRTTPAVQKHLTLDEILSSLKGNLNPNAPDSIKQIPGLTEFTAPGNFSGIYFGYRGEAINYVGASRCIGRALPQGYVKGYWNQHYDHLIFMYKCPTSTHKNKLREWMTLLNPRFNRSRYIGEWGIDRVLPGRDDGPDRGGNTAKN